jgi:hypothetical protein
MEAELAMRKAADPLGSMAGAADPAAESLHVNRHAFGTPPHINARVLMCRRNLWTDGVPIGADRDPICLTEYSFGSNGWVRFNRGSHLGAETHTTTIARITSAWASLMPMYLPI